MLKKQLKLPLIHFDQPFHPVILYKNYLIGLVMNINKTSKMCIGLVINERVGVRSSLWAPCCVLEQGTFTPKKVLIIHRKPWLRPDMTEIKQK